MSIRVTPHISIGGEVSEFTYFEPISSRVIPYISIEGEVSVYLL